MGDRLRFTKKKGRLNDKRPKSREETPKEGSGSKIATACVSYSANTEFTSCDWPPISWVPVMTIAFRKSADKERAMNIRSAWK